MKETILRLDEGWLLVSILKNVAWNTRDLWQEPACNRPIHQRSTDRSGAVNLIADVIHLRVDSGSKR